MMTKAVYLIGGVAAVFATGCEHTPEEPATRSEQHASAAVVAIPDDVFVTAVPTGARGVGEIKADESAAGEVVVRGRIAGRKHPFVPGAAVFLLTDPSIKSCDEIHKDTCPTPWDHCCEPRESLAANTATVQIIDKNGKPYPVTAEGQHGLTPLALLTIVGDVASRAGGTLVINAHKIHVQQTSG